MRAGLSFWGANETSCLGGNAKVYDGSFDYDTFTALSTGLNTYNPKTYHIRLKPNFIGTGLSSIFSIGGSDFNSGTYGLNIAVRNGRIILYYLGTSNVTGNRKVLYIIASTPLVLSADTSVIITDAGTGLASGIQFYINNVVSAKSVQNNTLNTTMQPFATPSTIGRASDSSANFIYADIRHLEILNRVATVQEIADCYANGAFKCDNTISLADYLLAINFNKSGTDSLTTVAGTPSYTITAFGGASYTPY